MELRVEQVKSGFTFWHTLYRPNAVDAVFRHARKNLPYFGFGNLATLVLSALVMLLMSIIDCI